MCGEALMTKLHRDSMSDVTQVGGNWCSFILKSTVYFVKCKTTVESICTNYNAFFL